MMLALEGGSLAVFCLAVCDFNFLGFLLSILRKLRSFGGCGSAASYYNLHRDPGKVSKGLPTRLEVRPDASGH